MSSIKRFIGAGELPKQEYIRYGKYFCQVSANKYTAEPHYWWDGKQMVIIDKGGTKDDRHDRAGYN